MKVLVIGNGGREHALAWKLARSPRVREVIVAPGNAGTARERRVRNAPVAATDIDGLVRLAQTEAVALTVVGPEAPLALGVVDRFRAAGLRCFGPRRIAAQLESSKAYAKDFLARHAIPSAHYAVFTELKLALQHVRRHGAPIVIKADGLAAGKGVVVATDMAEAEAAITDFMEAGKLGAAGARVVIEECLIGEEVSLFALADGEEAIFLGAAQDHKRVGDGDTGPNTGGMGAYSPPPALTPEIQEAAMTRIIRPALAALARRGTPFRGILFAGLMLTAEGPKLIEFNVRFGDPECQALLPRLKSDLLPALLAACDGELAAFDLRWHDQAAITVALAARGYPGKPALGGEIRGLAAAGAVPGVRIFHAGTARDQDGRLIAAGGRVLSVTATGETLHAARDAAYAAIARIDFPDGFCRRDIGWRALASDG